MQQLEIGTNEAGQRLDKYLKKLLPQAESSFIYKMLRKKNIVRNGQKTQGSVHLAPGDRITLYFSDETFAKFSAPRPFLTVPRAELKILYEDKEILMIDKPAGMLSQKAAASDYSANEQIIQYLLDSGAVTQQTLKTFRPSVCNRLDRNTSGILIAGKTLHGLQKMSEQLKERSIKKYYRCIVSGDVRQGQRLKGWLKKDTKSNQVTVTSSDQSQNPKESGTQNSQYIETEYQPVGQGDGCTMLEVHLITGRPHQIRAHLASVGHPIIGDRKYGDPAVNSRYYKEAGITHQLLHAYRVELADGTQVTAPLPDDFAEIPVRTMPKSCQGPSPKE